MRKTVLLPTVLLGVFLLAPFVSGGFGDGVCLPNGNCRNNDECGKTKYQQDPNAYPSPNMGRYEFIRAYYAVLRLLARCYYGLVNAAFSLLNAFSPAEHVEWHDASSLLFIPALKAAEMIRRKELTSTLLVSAYIHRIKLVNNLTNGIHNENFKNALKEAKLVDNLIAMYSAAEIAYLAKTKPFFGVPFTSKANLKTKGFVTHSCNRYLMENPPSHKDAPIVARVKKAGAILLGITAMPNLGLSWAGDDTACGQVNNPHDARRTPGGSSSGEGATISSAGSLFGIGNDIGGSVRVPSHMCGIFGLKPTNYPNHTVPVEGIVPNFTDYKPAANMLTNGPLVRYASDLPVVLSVMADKPLDFFNKSVNFTRDVKIYYLEDHDVLISEPLHDEQRDEIRKVKNYFEQTFNVSVQKVELPLMNRLFELWGLDGWSQGLLNLTDVIPTASNIFNGVANTTFLGLEFDIIKAFTHPKDHKERAFVAAKLEKFRRQVSDLLGNHGLLLLPMTQTPVPFHNMEPFVSTNLVYAMTWNLLGNPALAAPTGKSADTNMPLGVQFVANFHNENLLVAVAQVMEKAFGGWVQPGGGPPKFIPL